MKYLLDTNIISNMTKPQPNKGIMKWFVNTLDMDMFISVMSIGEITLDGGKTTKKQTSTPPTSNILKISDNFHITTRLSRNITSLNLIVPNFF